jgi:hypothetical protein
LDTLELIEYPPSPWKQITREQKWKAYLDSPARSRSGWVETPLQTPQRVGGTVKEPSEKEESYKVCELNARKNCRTEDLTSDRTTITALKQEESTQENAYQRAGNNPGDMRMPIRGKSPMIMIFPKSNPPGLTAVHLS